MSWFLYPTAGITSLLSYLQFDNRQLVGGAIFLFATIISIMFASYVKLKLGKQQLTVTETQNDANTSILLMKMMQEENVRREEFWTRRIDEVAEKLRTECEKEKIFWVDREQKVREEKHQLGNECNAITGNYRLLTKQLTERGILITEDVTIIWPERLKRTRQHDPIASSGEFSMKENENVQK